jgi:hypothetical protein
LRGLILVLVIAAPVAAQPVETSAAPETNRRRIVLRLYAAPSMNRMADWRADIDALQEEALARNLPISNTHTNGIGAGGTVLVQVTARMFIGGEFEAARDYDAFTTHEPYGGSFFPGSADFGTTATTVVRMAELAVALYPRQQSRIHLQAGVGMGWSHVSFQSRTADNEGRGDGLSLSGLFGVEWKMLYLSGGGRFYRARVDYTPLHQPTPTPRDLFANDGFVGGRNVDLTGVFLRVGLAFDWFHETH